MLITLTTISLATISKLLHVIAFLLPLKVILLMGSNHVPRYFRSFIEPDLKLEWAFGLAIATVIFYLTALFLDALNDKLITIGSRTTVQAANKMSFVSKQDTLSNRYFSRLTNIFSLLSFLVVSLAVLSWVSPTVFFSFLVLSFTTFTITSLLQTFTTDNKNNAQFLQSTFTTWLLRNRRNYVDIITTAFFIICFFIILFPYFKGDGPNILLSLIAFVLIRQMTRRSKALINSLFVFYRNRDEVNALVFKGFQSPKELAKSTGNKSLLFNPETRKDIIAKYLSLSNDELSSLHLSWIPVDNNHIKEYNLSFTKDGVPYCFQWHIYNTHSLFVLEREYFLFDYLSRDALSTAHSSEYEFSGFKSQLLDCSSCTKITVLEFNENFFIWMKSLAFVVPPKRLIKAYKLSIPLLYQKLNHDLVDSQLFFSNSDHELATLNHFKSILPTIQAKLQNIPLYIHNPSLDHNHVLWTNKTKTNIKITSWKNWSLQPVGAHIEEHHLNNDALLENYLEGLESERKDMLNKNVSIQDLKLSSICYRLEQSLKLGEFYKSLQLMDAASDLIKEST